MDQISETELAEIERRIVAAMVEAFGVDLSGLVLDMTNFATYIDSANDRAPIAQRGHAKQKRTDLRLVGLGLVVSTDGGVPLVSHAYAGQPPRRHPVPDDGRRARRPASRRSAGDAGRAHLGLRRRPELRRQLRAVRGLAAALRRLAAALRPPRSARRGQVPLPGRRQGALPRPHRLRDQKGRLRRRAPHRRHPLARTCTTSSPPGFDQTLAKARRQLAELAARLARGKTRKPREKVEAEIAAILKPRWLSRVISTTLTGDDPRRAAPRLPHRTRRPGRPRRRAVRQAHPVHRQRHERAPTAEIVADYRSQEAVEADFRQMKDPKVVSFSPMFHFTEQKIRVHVFYCVLALTVARLMVREADRAGIT